MSYNEILLKRVREALANLPNVEEKKMFGSVAFMVNNKMCVTVGENRIMCRIDPALHDNAIMNKGVQTIKMRGRDYKGYVHVDEDVIKTKKELDRWVELALDFNKIAKASRKSK